LRRALEAAPALVDEIEPDMRLAVIASAGSARGGRIFVRELDRLPRDFAFGQPAALGDLLDDVPIAVARPEIHPGVDSAGILAQLLFDRAHRLDEIAPVHRAQETEAADRIADRDLHARLLLRSHLHHLLDREPRLRQAL